jgi:enoyl-CoA hydratase
VILAETYTPTDGVAAGFLDRVVHGDDLLEAATSIADQFSGLDQRAHATTKAHARAFAIEAIRSGLSVDMKIFGRLPTTPPASG